MFLNFLFIRCLILILLFGISLARLFLTLVPIISSLICLCKAASLRFGESTPPTTKHIPHVRSCVYVRLLYARNNTIINYTFIHPFRGERLFFNLTLDITQLFMGHYCVCVCLCQSIFAPSSSCPSLSFIRACIPASAAVLIATRSSTEKLDSIFVYSIVKFVYWQFNCDSTCLSDGWQPTSHPPTPVRLGYYMIVRMSIKKWTYADGRKFDIPKICVVRELSNMYM